MEHLIGEAECGYLIPIYLLITCDNIFQNYNPVSEKTFKSEKQLVWERGRPGKKIISSISLKLLLIGKNK
jgi:hypothetical protein